MGRVYQAEQEKPKRTVALKVIKAGVTSPELLRRFEHETEALGRLQHPGIAQIYSAGTAQSADGQQPFFAMELVRGEPLVEYVQSHRLDTRRCLELLARVCDAVHHAHQRGLIHRDLKPANILVDESGQPKVLDFGVARLVDAHPQDTRQTDVGQLIGTVYYMSPEQVLADPRELDIRSDVYALGVILYELITGRLPYPIRNRPLHEAVEIIRGHEVTPLGSVNRAWRGDIHTIVSKALEKDKDRRYGSAAEFAADLRRYLNNEPIAARPATASYQLRKFAIRHRAAVTGITVVVFVLIAASIVSALFALRARDAERAAIRAAAVARAVNDFLQSDLLAQASSTIQARPNVTPDPNLTVRTAVDRAAEGVATRFESQPEVEASIRHTIGTTYSSLGLYSQAEDQLRRAVDLRLRLFGEQHPDSLSSKAALAAAYYWRGDYSDAESLYNNVVKQRRETLGSEHPDTMATMSELALVYDRQGKYTEARSVQSALIATQRRVLGDDHPATLSSINRLAIAEEAQGHYPEAEALHTQVEAVRVRVLGADHPDSLASRLNLAAVYYRQGRYERAEPLFADLIDRFSRVLGQEHPQTLMVMNNLAGLRFARGRFKEAEPLFATVLQIRRRVLGNEHPNTLSSVANLAQSHIALGRDREATRLLEEAVSGRRRISGADHPLTLAVLNAQAVLYGYTGRDREAEILLGEVLETRRRTLGDEHPDTLGTMNDRANLYRAQGRYREAEAQLVTVLMLRNSVLGHGHPDTADTAVSLAWVRLLQDKYADAHTLLREYQSVLDDSKPQEWFVYALRALFGVSLASQQRYDEAKIHFQSGHEGLIARASAIPRHVKPLLVDLPKWSPAKNRTTSS